MIKQLLTMILMALVFNLVIGKVALAQNKEPKSVQQINEVKAKIAKIGTGEKAKIKIELHDKTKIKGLVSAIGEDSFTLTDKKTGAATQIAYAQVKKVSRDGISLGAKIAIGAGAAAAAIVLIFFFQYYCNEQAC